MAVAGPDVTVFQLERGRAALEKYAIANHLTLRIYGADGHLVTGAVNRTPLYDLLSGGHDPGMFAACVLACLSQSDATPPVVVEREQYGIAVVGTPLVLAGEVVGAAVAG